MPKPVGTWPIQTSGPVVVSTTKGLFSIKWWCVVLILWQASWQSTVTVDTLRLISVISSVFFNCCFLEGRQCGLAGKSTGLEVRDLDSSLSNSSDLLFNSPPHPPCYIFLICKTWVMCVFGKVLW